MKDYLPFLLTANKNDNQQIDKILIGRIWDNIELFSYCSRNDTLLINICVVLKKNMAFFV